MGGEQSNRGVEDGTTRFVHNDLNGVGRYRRFGTNGPLYEVTGVQGEKARIRVILSGEETVYPIASALSDPLG